MTTSYERNLTIDIRREPRRGWIASTTIGNTTLEVARHNEADARAALIALYEDTLFGEFRVNRTAARRLRAAR